LDNNQQTVDIERSAGAPSLQTEENNAPAGQFRDPSSEREVKLKTSAYSARDVREIDVMARNCRRDSSQVSISMTVKLPPEIQSSLITLQDTLIDAAASADVSWFDQITLNPAFGAHSVWLVTATCDLRGRREVREGYSFVDSKHEEHIV
jgi:hypothetical protein